MQKTNKINKSKVDINVFKNKCQAFVSMYVVYRSREEQK